MLVITGLFTGLFCGKRPAKTTHSMRRLVSGAVAQTPEGTTNLGLSCRSLSVSQPVITGLVITWLFCRKRPVKIRQSMRRPLSGAAAQRPESTMIHLSLYKSLSASEPVIIALLRKETRPLLREENGKD